MFTAKDVIENALNEGLIEQYANDYAEPGYSLREGQLGILFANWNGRGEWNPETKRYSGNLMPRLAEVAERAGYKIEWSDEWTLCDECAKAIRTSPDCYEWQASYWMSEGFTCCADCIDPAEYLLSLEGDPRHAVTITHVVPEDHGYVLVKEGMAHGWYPDQNDSPEVVAKSLRARDVNRFVFKIDGVGQFDMDFSVCVHESEAHLLGEEPSVASKLPYKEFISGN